MTYYFCSCQLSFALLSSFLPFCLPNVSVISHVALKLPAFPLLSVHMCEGGYFFDRKQKGDCFKIKCTFYRINRQG